MEIADPHKITVRLTDEEYQALLDIIRANKRQGQGPQSQQEFFVNKLLEVES